MFSNARCIAAPSYGMKPGEDWDCRQAPSSDYRVCDTLSFGEYVAVDRGDGKENQWLHIESRGWVLRIGIGFLNREDAALYGGRMAADDSFIQARIDNPWLR